MTLPSGFLDTPVLIAGGGPVGLALAVELGLRGVECLVVEPRPQPTRLRPRAKTLSARTMEHARRWGLGERLRAAPPLPVSWSRTVPLAAEYVVGADGARSVVREQMGARYVGSTALGANTGVVFRSEELVTDHAELSPHAGHSSHADHPHHPGETEFLDTTMATLCGRPRSLGNMGKIALTNVRVFDGERLAGPSTVVIDGYLIGSDPAGATQLDGDGRVLLPGLIDCHIHLTDDATLAALARHGVTTALDMGTWPPELVASLRGRPGVTDIRSSGTGATHPDSAHAKRMGHTEGLVADPDEARAYVSRRVAEGVDYIKIIVDPPGFDTATVVALVEAAHAQGLRTIGHAANREAVLLAQAAGIDVLTHAPIDRGLGDSEVESSGTSGKVVVPTLTMMEAIVEKIRAFAPVSYDVARSTVGQWHRAGVTILAGTDANQAPSAPASPPYGASLHHELELLVDAGLSTTDALRAATVLAAGHFGLSDRGVIAPGKRADFVLIDGDPLRDISAISKIAAVWCAGVPVDGASN